MFILQSLRNSGRHRCLPFIRLIKVKNIFLWKSWNDFFISWSDTKMFYIIWVLQPVDYKIIEEKAACMQSPLPCVSVPSLDCRFSSIIWNICMRQSMLNITYLAWQLFLLMLLTVYTLNISRTISFFSKLVDLLIKFLNTKSFFQFLRHAMTCITCALYNVKTAWLIFMQMFFTLTLPSEMA